MSKTPRTDEHLRRKEENGHTVIVSSEFVRQLETELADKEKQLAEAKPKMCAALKVCKCYFEEAGLYEDSIIYGMICAALEAAEEGEKK